MQVARCGDVSRSASVGVSPVVLFLVLNGASACVGDIGAAGDGVEPTTEVTAAVCAERPPSPGKNPMRRLTSFQYANTVRDLLGASIDPGDDFPKTSVSQGFRTFIDANIVSGAGAEDIQRAAELVAQQATSDLGALLGCDADGANGSTCVQAFVATLAARAYRRPVSPDELDLLEAVYTVARAGGYDATEGVAMVLEVVLQSPQFIYRLELAGDAGAAGVTIPVGDYEAASRLSYLLWDTMPDDELLALAAAGALHEPAAIEAQARRMIDDPRARPVLGRFAEDWLQMQRLDASTKDTAVFPQYGAELDAAYREEVGRFVAHAVWELDGRLATLLTTPVAVVNAPLAELYGVEGPATADDWMPVELDASQRAGLLTTAGFLAGHANAVTTSPIARGAFVRNQVLCQVMFPPPGIDLKLPAYDPDVSVRERLAQHRTDPACSGCHQLMDPVGFGFENYDAIGQWRTTEGNDLPVDASGELAQAGEISGPFVGAVELAHALADSEMVRACMALQAFRAAVGREEADPDQCSVVQARDRFVASDADMRELLVALTQTDAFLYRVIPDVQEEP
jgi:hypothetical protein